eukprot:6201647-Pleurochrysis_carterae.AAC.4
MRNPFRHASILSDRSTSKRNRRVSFRIGRFDTQMRVFIIYQRSRVRGLAQAPRRRRECRSRRRPCLPCARRRRCVVWT